MSVKHIKYKNFRLAFDLAISDLDARYKRSILGWSWLLLTPLGLLGIYSVVFGGILGVRWNDESGTSIGYSLPMFVGLATYLFLSDLVNSSTSLFVSKRTFVVKSSFPIWVLWVSNFIQTSITACVSLLLLLAFALWSGTITLYGLAFTCIVIIPSALFLAAVSLILSVLGPFIGDISQSVRLVLRVILYAAPITYPIAIVPNEYRYLLWVNPITCIVEPLRQAIVFGAMPYLTYMTALFVLSSILMSMGIWMFKRVRGIIPDVV
jgi:lipopolysaccharide transport system permease protein